MPVQNKTSVVLCLCKTRLLWCCACAKQDFCGVVPVQNKTSVVLCLCKTRLLWCCACAKQDFCGVVPVQKYLCGRSDRREQLTGWNKPETRSLFVNCLTSQQHTSVSQGWMCSDNWTCCHTEIEVADQTFHRSILTPGQPVPAPTF